MGNKSAAVISQSQEDSYFIDSCWLSCLLQSSNSFQCRANSFFREENADKNQSVHIEQAFLNIEGQTMLSETFHSFVKALVMSCLVWAMYSDVIRDIVDSLYSGQSGRYLILVLLTC